HRESLRSVRRDDPRALRSRVSRLVRRSHMVAISVPLQAAGRSQAARNLRALPAAIRMEPVVRLAWGVATVPLRALDRRAPPYERARCPRAVRCESIRGRTAEAG